MLPLLRRSRPGFLYSLFFISLPVIALPICFPQTNRAQTDFTPPIARPLVLRDVNGKPHSLSDYKGKGTVVYFFCGCEWCQHCAHAWSDMQKEGALPQDAAGKPLQTLMVFAGDAAATRAFAASTGLDTKQNLLLPDPDLRVTADYKAAECPRVFVIDSDGFVRYTNNHQYDAPRKASALVIVSNAVGAMRAAMNAPISLAPLSPARLENVNPSALTVLAEQGVESVTRGQGRYNFGSIDTLTTRTVEHNFILCNDAKMPLILHRLGSSCGCTTAYVDSAPATSPLQPTPEGRTLKPGEHISVHVSVDVSRLRSGSAKKLVWVFAQGSGQPAATLELSGTVQSPITFSPAVVNFGEVKAGAEASRILTASFDPRLIVAGEAPSLISTNPDVEIVPIPADASLSSPVATVNTAHAPAFVTRVYTVRLLPHAPPGNVSGTISVLWEPPVAPRKRGETRRPPPAVFLVGAPAVLIGNVKAP